MVMYYNLVNKYRIELMGIAAFMVFLRHSCDFVWNHMHVVSKLFMEGGSGVDIFLILSGIGLYYSFSGNNNIIEFYRKRFLRIVPVYLIIVVPYFVWQFVHYNQTVWDFISNILTISYWTNGGSFWYVSHIIIFYLLYPLLYKYVIHNNKLFYIVLIMSIAMQIVIMTMGSEFYIRVHQLITRVPITLLACKLGEKAYKNLKMSKKLVIVWIALFIVLRGLRVLLVPDENPGLVVFMVKTANMFGMLAFAYLYSWIRGIIDDSKKTVIAEKCIESVKAVFQYMGNRSLEMYLVHLSICMIIHAYAPECSVLYCWIIVLPVTLILMQVYHKIYYYWGRGRLSTKCNT